MEKPPRWLATDLRDGNQSNEDPMVCPYHQRFQSRDSRVTHLFPLTRLEVAVLD